MSIDNFFETLGKTLWSIEKHPFRKPGEFQKGGNVVQLSYDPSRVFKKQGEENPFENDEEYLQFQREERFNNLLYDKNLLVQQFKEVVIEIRQKQEKMKVKRSQVVKNKFTMYNPFLHERQRCIACSECLQYEGNFRMNKVKNIGLFQCMNCGCPMNAHRQIVKDRLFSQLLYDSLKDKDLNDDCLQANIFVGALSFNKIAINMNLNKIMNILGQGGYTVISYQSMSSIQFKQKMIQQKLFSRKIKFSSLQKFESILNFVRFLHHSTRQPEDYLNSNDHQTMSGQIKQYKQLDSQVNQQFLVQGDEVLCLLLQCNQNKRHNYSKFMFTIKQFLKNIYSLYSSPDNYTSLIDCQIFFSEYFKISYEAFITLNNDTKSAYSLKDTLDLNEYIIIKNGLHNVKRQEVERAFQVTKNPHLVNYILGSHVVSENIPYLDLKIVARVGTPQLTTVGQLPPFVRFQEETTIKSLMKNLCGKLLDSQRCAIILRPALTSSGIDNLVINFLRLNDFNIIGRTSASLTDSQIRMFQIFENIAQQDSQSYRQMMKGLVQIVLVSKRRAIMQSKIIAEGCAYGFKKFKARVIRQQPQFHLEINKKGYIQQIQIFEPKFWQQSQLHIFNGVKNLFSLQNLIFGPPSKHQSVQLIEATTGNIIRQSTQDSPKKKINPKLRQAILEELNNQIFNFWMYTSVSETITEQIINEFMPQCAAYQSICLIIKPGYGHLSNVIKEAIEQLKYKIVFSKTLILSKLSAQEIVKSLLILKNADNVKKIAQKYGSERVQLLCVAKQSARRQILYFLRNFSMESKRVVQEGATITDDILQDVLVPVWQEQQIVLSIFHPILQNIQRSLININKLQRNDLFNLLTYLVGSILGQDVKDIPLRTETGQLSYSVVQNAQQAKIQSWYYALINRTGPLYVPLLYQYRQFNNLTFILQSTIGQQLFKYIFRSYLKNKTTLTKGGRSLVLFIWAKKLADMVGDLSEIKPQLNGYGTISKFKDDYRGVTFDDNFKSQQIAKVKLLISKWSQRDRQVVAHLERTLQKRGFKQRCKLKNKRLLPKVEEGNLRAVRSSRLSKLVLKDEIQMIDPNNQLAKSAELLTINLYNTLPQQMPKYWLWCQIYVNILRYTQADNRFKQPADQFLQLFIQVSNKQVFEDLQMLAVELYLQIAKQYQQGGTFLYPLVKLGLLDFKRLGKLNETDETFGKKRKFIPKPQVHKKNDDSNKPDLLQTVHKFNQYQYNVYSQAPLPDSKSLFNKNDPLHQIWVKQKRVVNLLRQASSQKKPRNGVYVQFQKKIDQNQQQLKRKVQQQALRYNQQDQKILYDQQAGSKNIWYRNKHQSSYKPKSKMDQAIQTQLIRLMQFKQTNNNS